MESAGNTTAWAPAGDPSPRAEEDAAGLLSALTAYAYLWPCRRVGARARTLGRPLVSNGARVEIGDDVVIDSRAERVHLACRGRGRLVVGDGVRIGPGTRIAAAHQVEIGDGTRIGARCLIADGGERSEGADIWIGDGVTLGDGVRVLPGTVIGAGAIVAAGSVVAGRVPAGARVAPGRTAPAE